MNSLLDVVVLSALVASKVPAQEEPPLSTPWMPQLSSLCSSPISAALQSLQLSCLCSAAPLYSSSTQCVTLCVPGAPFLLHFFPKMSVFPIWSARQLNSVDTW